VFVDESLWLRRVLAHESLQPGMTVLDIGSSTLQFRTVVQPHIDENVFAPLRARGLSVLHLDARAEPGVDIVADVSSLAGVDREFDVVLCTNLLEHVVDRESTLRNVKRVVSARGLLVLTVPNRYPLHADPIDTGYRPTAKALVELVGWPEVIHEEVVTIQHERHYRGLRRLRRRLSPWRIACAVLRKPTA
jgi:ubiquinone/menaquinone biosynthesis C-methylase UbiE